ncbi:Gas vesicle protein G [Micromonospora pattaloongensis]|uniref:Gas vesicle protein G n=1 Tax=Micromonospora pattaloongensis TaxID=405436 RepID=A0A1H3Q9R1_9ACTN|nr:gas vesicle protein GvpG [Micromonospora pattaloongensis]SDZ10013.1 Gas vesicle protein G [Micromonospora pattaloongensis]
MLLTLLTLPLAPVRALPSLVRLLRDRANEQLYDPATLQRQLEELDAAAAAGQISDEELAEAQQRIIDRLLG